MGLKLNVLKLEGKLLEPTPPVILGTFMNVPAAMVMLPPAVFLFIDCVVPRSSVAALSIDRSPIFLKPAVPLPASTTVGEFVSPIRVCPEAR